jgi:hypothetical protein
MSYEDAQLIAGALPPYEDFAPMPLQVLLDNGSHLLVARENLPLHHAYAIVSALLEESERLGLTVPLDGTLGITVHPGARAAALGEALAPPVADAK